MSAGSVSATAHGSRITIAAKPVAYDNFLANITVKLGDLAFGATFEVLQAGDLVAQLRAAADTLEAWDAARDKRVGS